MTSRSILLFSNQSNVEVRSVALDEEGVIWITMTEHELWTFDQVHIMGSVNDSILY